MENRKLKANNRNGKVGRELLAGAELVDFADEGGGIVGRNDQRPVGEAKHDGARAVGDVSLIVAEDGAVETADVAEKTTDADCTNRATQHPGSHINVA